VQWKAYVSGNALRDHGKVSLQIKDTTLNPGDTILLLFEDMADQTPEQIINYLKNEGASWVDNKDPDDDVTFVVIKVKE
jgi:hypothetical protein